MTSFDCQRRMQSLEAAFSVLTIGALYIGSERGLAADILAARALGGTAHGVCTALVVAGSGRVTDVVEVPADTVDAQLEHLLATKCFSAIKIGILSGEKTVSAVFRRLRHIEDVPLLLDVTVSGHEGETVLTTRGVDELMKHLHVPDMVTMRLHDAELLSGVVIDSLDAAQVAAQRLARKGARQIVIRCGRIRQQFFEAEQPLPDWAADLYFDGDSFSVLEAPWLDAPLARGASSAFCTSFLQGITTGKPFIDALQQAKVFATQAIRFRSSVENGEVLNYFWNDPSYSPAGAPLNE